MFTQYGSTRHINTKPRNERGGHSTSRKPRIVKLHGTLPILSAEMILTEEDFRRYENRSSLVRGTAYGHSLSEKHALPCRFLRLMIQNFLACVRLGIRGHTGGQTTRTFCFSAASLSADFQDELLQSRNITPIAIDERRLDEQISPQFSAEAVVFPEQDPSDGGVFHESPRPSLVAIEADNAAALRGRQ